MEGACGMSKWDGERNYYKYDRSDMSVVAQEVHVAVTE